MIKIELTCNKPDKVLNVVSQNVDGISYSFANKLLRKKDIRINNQKISENISVNFGDKIVLFVEDDFKENADDFSKSFQIEYQDDNVMFVNKAKGIEVTSPTENITVEKLLNKTSKVYPLNRLDRNTEGLVIFAKNKNIFEKLKKSMKKDEIEKFYLAEVVGTPKFDEKTAIAYLKKDDEKSEVKIFDTPKKDSVKIETDISVLSRSSGGTSVLIVHIKNGKTHQIRAHLAYLGFPIIGDGKYGSNQENKKFKSKTQKLTAFKLRFNFTDKELNYLNEKEIEIKPTWL